MRYEIEIEDQCVIGLPGNHVTVISDELQQAAEHALARIVGLSPLEQGTTEDGRRWYRYRVGVLGYRFRLVELPQ